MGSAPGPLEEVAALPLLPSMEVGKRLVSPDLRLYIVADSAALRDLVKALELGWVLGGNLQQLCGWGDVGFDRDGRKETANWQLLEDVHWLKHDKSDELVPVVGKVGPHIYQTVVLQRADMDFVQSSLKKLLNGSLKQLQGWRKVERPAAARWLQHGESLKGFSALQQCNVQVLCEYWLH